MGASRAGAKGPGGLLNLLLRAVQQDLPMVVQTAHTEEVGWTAQRRSTIRPLAARICPKTRPIAIFFYIKAYNVGHCATVCFRKIIFSSENLEQFTVLHVLMLYPYNDVTPLICSFVI